MGTTTMLCKKKSISISYPKYCFISSGFHIIFLPNDSLELYLLKHNKNTRKSQIGYYKSLLFKKMSLISLFLNYKVITFLQRSLVMTKYLHT